MEGRLSGIAGPAVLLRWMAAAFFWGGTMWLRPAPHRPGGGAGFAVTVGTLLPVSGYAMLWAASRVNRAATRIRSAVLVTASVTAGGLGAMASIAAFGVIPFRHGFGTGTVAHGTCAGRRPAGRVAGSSRSAARSRAPG